MIVVDTNIITYLFIQGEHTERKERFEKTVLFSLTSRV
jgi:predicted nucleic acid-binding protein